MSEDSERCKADIERAFHESWRLLNRPDGWHTAKTTTLACDSVDKVEWRTRHQGFGAKRIFRITATLPASVEKVSALLRNVNNIASWNRTVQAARIVKRLDHDTVITYHRTASNGGLVFPRDFVLGVKFGLVDGCFVAGGCSVDFPGLSPVDGVVRAWNDPSCLACRPVIGAAKLACTLQWLLDCDYGGWVPTALQNVALPFAQVLLVDSLLNILREPEEEEKIASARDILEKKNFPRRLK